MDLKMEALTSFAGLAILGTVFAAIIRGWANIKGFVHRCFSFFVTQIHFEDDQTSQAVLAHLIKNYKRSSMGEKTFGGKHDTFSDGKYGHVPYEFFGGHSLVFWKGWIPFWFVATVEKSDDKVILWDKKKATIKSSVYFIRSTINVEDIVKKASNERNDMYWATSANSRKRFFIKRIPDATQQQGRVYSAGTNLAWYFEGVYRLLNHTPEDLGKVSITCGGERVTNNLYFPDHITNLIHEVEMWRKLRTWYEERAIPWKRGILFFGIPGCGKSAIARAIAEDLDMPLFVYSLGQMINEELERSWAEMQAHVPCMALFEDFDNVFHGRENVYGKASLGDLLVDSTQGGPVTVESPLGKFGKLSFDCLLNCIDGVEKSNGIFTVITTNHVDTLDSALGRPIKKEDGTIEFISTRPGRIDKAIELGYMDNECKLKLAKRIFFDNDTGYQNMISIIKQDSDKKETPAQFQERCAQMALKLLWGKEQNNKTITNSKTIIPNHKLIPTANGCVRCTN